MLYKLQADRWAMLSLPEECGGCWPVFDKLAPLLQTAQGPVVEYIYRTHLEELRAKVT